MAADRSSEPGRIVTLQEADAAMDGALGRMIERVGATLDSSLGGFPHYADPGTGAWTTTADGFWTGGFWVAQLWLTAYLRDDQRYRDGAAAWCRRLAPRVDTPSVFRSFLFYYGAACGALLHDDTAAGRLAVAAGRSVAADFDDRLGVIPLGAQAEEARNVGPSESNVDGLSACPLILWTARQTGEASLAEVATLHALRSAALFVRDDDSVIQSASLDSADGRPLRHYTHKGHSDNSTWTRAQAWAMLFFTQAYRYSGDPALCRIAERVSDWWIAHAPAGAAAFWDFDAPRTPDTRRDTSGTAIAAVALFKLAAATRDRDKAAIYQRAARNTTLALAFDHVTPTGPDDWRPAGILADGCFDPREGTAVANELIWGSYFMLEALSVATGRLGALTL